MKKKSGEPANTAIVDIRVTTMITDPEPLVPEPNPMPDPAPAPIPEPLPVPPPFPEPSPAPDRF
jgi:hypothetical protein